MAVYVDDMRAGFGRLILCHMIADTSFELVTLAAAVGLDVRHIQHPGTAREHFDVSLGKRAELVRLGAREITWRQCGAMTRRRRREGTLGRPEDAVEWLTRRAVANFRRTVVE